MVKRQNKKNKTIQILISVIVIMLLTSFLYALFYNKSDDKILCNDEQYIEILKEVYPKQQFVIVDDKSTYSSFQNGKSIVTYDHIAMPLINENSKYTFIPQYKETVLIVVDRDLTTKNIRSYQELFSSDNDISLFLGDLIASNVWGGDKAHHIYASLSYAMYGEYDIKKLAKDLNKFEDMDKLFINENKPFMIMTDKEAVELKKQGRNIEIILPSDGTHTFVCGILTNKKIETNKILLNEKLVEKGYRTMDDQVDLSVYPNIDDYNVAKPANISAYNSAVTDALKIIRRDVFDTKRYGTAINNERGIVFIVLLVLITIYLASLSKRVKQNNIRIAITLTGLAQIGLMACYIIRMMVSKSSCFYTLLWYLYYVFFAMLSAAFLYISLYVGTSKCEKQERIKNIAYCIYLIITSFCLLLIMTNDLHQQVFDIISITGEGDKYAYMWGYYLTCIVIYAPTIFAITLLIYKAQQSPKKFAMIYPCLAVLLLFIYGVLYILEVPIGRDLDIAFGVTLFSWLIMESCLKTGLVPVNVGYNKLFSKSKLNMQILTSSGVNFKSYDGVVDVENTEKIINDLPSGQFIYYKDIKEINNIKQEIASTIAKLKKNNEIIKQENEIKQEIAKNIATQKTYLKINEIIKQDKVVIETLLEEMKTASNKAEYISRINILAIGMKRKSMLKIGSVAEQVLDVAIIESSINEIKQFIKNIDLKFSSICRITKSIPCTYKMLEVYSIYLRLIDKAILKGANFVFVQIYEERDNFILSFTVDKDILTNEEIKKFMSQTSININKNKWEENNIVLLSIAKEEKYDRI